MNSTATEGDIDAFVSSASQIFAYYSWYVEISPRLLGTPSRRDEMLHFRITEIAVCTGFLMNVRRLDEFFRLRSNRPDDARASHFGFSTTDGFLSDDLRRQIKKHIAHPTQLVSGAVEHTYLIYQLAHKALVAVVEFLDFILEGPHRATTKYGKSVAYTKAKYLWVLAAVHRTSRTESLGRVYLPRRITPVSIISIERQDFILLAELRSPAALAFQAVSRTQPRTAHPLLRPAIFPLPNGTQFHALERDFVWIGSRAFAYCLFE